ncbi:MAG TPA: VanW family protein [Solirubrobacteraceae bacterium]|nr:VanW family protein [Solirubrobacteraceae bacterium]
MQRLAVLAVVAVVGGVVLGLVFAGSPSRIAAGVRIDGVNVGGLTASEARAKLERRSAALAQVPVTFTAAGHEWRLRPASLGVETEWNAAVKLALDQGDGLAPIRGFRRLGVRVFGADVSPPTRVLEKALAYELVRMSRVVDRPHRDAALVLRQLRPVVLPAQAGRVLDRRAVGDVIVRALAGFERGRVALPVRVDQPTVRAADLAPVAAQVRTALARPVRMQLGVASWWLPKRQLAAILALPRDGASKLRVGGPGATRYFAKLGRGIGRPARDATFRPLSSGRVIVVPARPGRAVNAIATGRNILAAALSPTARTARVVVIHAEPKRTTAQARAMGITTRVGRYETIYGGDPNRIHNVQLVAHLVDGKLIAPGATFSFNRATGARTADKGFLEAPVIINGELTTGLGGGVCQVSTTVFNAAYEAGLKITERTNHALYISHYPQGRDATVNYPDVDLQFVNDTDHWLLLRTYVGSYSLEVELYGAPLHRRIVSETRPLVETGGPPLQRVPDAAMFVGQTVVEESGEPSRSTSVRRRVYTAGGALLYDNTWYSSYRGEPRVVRVGTKARPKPPPKKGPSGPSGPSGPTGATGVTSPQ